MRTFKTEGIIIKRRNIGEADKIITVLTKDLGKVQVKASGVRRITSRRSPHIELLNQAELTLYKGHNAPVLTEAQMVKDFSAIKNDLTKVGFAYHICELVDGLCPENQENETVFYLLKDVLERLSGDGEVAVVIHDFEIALLTELGYWNKAHLSQSLNTQSYIENILERRLKSRSIFAKIQ